ncbi:hypothetical protein CR203_04315 [Salipaludibacillus neizhouensis]|uniref:Uncharacterized protein n=1 Tax=Salipaludibacillus neizhouensis TaxID=885475 RepID=A0A3A9KAT7_9BACI|nr:hypothetical protein [Salipaludibacillus neizhouensis]RKL69259.1 hypothetical protein CR203_04315 [Salipaludibacillus neizhouensis]
MKKFLVIITILLLGFIGLSKYIFAQDGFDIKVINETNKEISGIYLTYDHIKSDIIVPSIEQGEVYKLNVNPTETFVENAMKLQYKDKEEKLHTEYVIGYFEKGYSGKAEITIKSVDENGKLDIEIVQNASAY